MKGIDDNQGENKSGLDQVVVLVRFLDIIDCYLKQKDDDYVFNFINLLVGIVVCLCIKIVGYDKKQWCCDG